MYFTLIVVLLSLSLNVFSEEAVYSLFNIVNQTNAFAQYFNLANKLPTVNYTDIYGFPLLEAADDFVLPAYTSLNLVNHQSSDCNSLSFSFNTRRTRQDTDPYSITIQLYYNNNSNDCPQNVPFYSRTLCSPNYPSNCSWDSRLNIPITTNIVLKNGDIADDNITVFNLSNMNLLPVGQRLWVALYATVPQHFRAPLGSNTLNWVTLNSDTGSTPIVTTFTNNVINSNYKYRDIRNVLRINATSWTDASVIQKYINVQTSTYNMAWSVSILCNIIPPIITESPTTNNNEVNTTVSPTSSITNQTITTESPTIGTPTEEVTGTPTEEPTIIIIIQIRLGMVDI
jgi:hypothetical protein